MNQKREKYPLALKLAVSLGEAQEFYSAEFLKSIPKGTKAAWRANGPQYYYALMEQNDSQSDIVKLLKKKEATRNREKAMLESYMSFMTFIKDTMGEKKFMRFLNDNKKEFVKHVEALPSSISKKRFLHTVGISASRYSGWNIDVNVTCFSSPDFTCVKRRPRQIAKVEHETIRKLAMKGGENKFAIWATNVKKGNIQCGQATFYKYTRDIETEHQKAKKPREPKLVRAKRIHQIWHADISVIRTTDGNKYYLYCVIDNKSRAVLSWSLEYEISKANSAKVLEMAFKNSRIRKRPKNPVKYMTDGGPENRNIQSEIRQSFTHLVAWKNIRSSNSMIERVFHTMKNEYKHVLSARNYTELKEIIAQVVEKYMDRPHSKLGIYTPREVIMRNDTWFDLPAVLSEGAEKRLKLHRNSPCNNCECSEENRCKTPDQSDGMDPDQ